jgi:translation initiation factor eIF-2B subunit delta
VPHVLNPQIEYLSECRPMCYAMGNAIRLLKAKVTQLDMDVTDEEASKFLCAAIDTLIEERICFAEVAVLRNATSWVENDDVVATFGGHRLVRKLLEKACKDGVSFRVEVYDDPLEGTGAALTTYLRSLGVTVTYHPTIANVSAFLRRSTKVLLGTEAVFANGAILAASGTADMALMAKNLSVPAIFLAESINIDRDRVAIDSLTYNEIDPDRCTADEFRLLFDATPARLVFSLITEYPEGSGRSAVQATQAVLRTKEDQIN